MGNFQEYVMIAKGELVEKVTHMKQDGYRLAQISATRKETFDLLYSFEKHYTQVNIRVELDITDEIDSISSVYPYAFLYENELKDLFGVSIINMNIDFNGSLYHTSMKTPFGHIED